MKATAIAPSNIAFIKYWGKKDEILRLPENGSISMNLSNLFTTTTVEFNKEFKKDEVIIDGKSEEIAQKRAIEHINKIRQCAKIQEKVKVVTKNNFPASTGLSSSASGFAALTVAGISAAGLHFSEKELSILARLGSGSACRSIPDGFVEWVNGDTNESSYAVSLYPQNYWDIADVATVVDFDKKDINTSQGQKLVTTSPFFKTRLSLIKNKITLIKKYMKDKNFTAFGELIEAETLEFHTILMTSVPSLLYWCPQTISVINVVKKMRAEGIETYFSINTGHNAHIICQKNNVKKVVEKLSGMQAVKKTIVNYASEGARLIGEDLF